jgi:hypothetical protein
MVMIEAQQETLFDVAEFRDRSRKIAVSVAAEAICAVCLQVVNVDEQHYKRPSSDGIPEIWELCDGKLVYITE